MVTHYTCALRTHSFLFFARLLPAFQLFVQELAGFGQLTGFLGASFFFGESWIVIRFPSSTGI